MSKYTTQVRYLRNTNFDFGLNEYPIFDETYRAILNKKILDHYNFREIGFETAELFKFYLNMRLNEIMPFYNPIYKYQLSMLSKDIFVNFDQTEELDRNINGNSNSKSSSSSSGVNKSKNLYQDTPQGVIDTINKTLEEQDHAKDIEFNKTENDNTINDDTTNESVNTESYTKHITGNIGARYYPEVMEVFIKNLMNIDLEIINKLNDLFMGIY